MKVLSLCDGIACGLMAFFEQIGNVEYHAVELDKTCREIADDNFKIKRWSHDVKEITKEDIKEHGPFDWVIFGSPCQSVSPASNGPGLKGKSGLLVDCMKVLKWCQEENPKLRYLIENVKMKKKYLDDFNEVIGHEPVLINSNEFVPQNRNRNYWVNFPILNWKATETHVATWLGYDVYGWSKSGRYKDDKTGKVYSSPAPGRTRYYEHRLNGGYHANTLNTGEGCRNQSTCNFVFNTIKSPNKSQLETWKPVSEFMEGFAQCCSEVFGAPEEYIYYRLLQPHECAKLQGIPNWFKFNSKHSKTALWKAIGNGWSVPVIQHLIYSGQKSLELPKNL